MELSREDVRRSIGVGSTVVGLVCYALSSSFNCLYGEWNSFKICAYIVSSSIICLAILLLKKRQGWRNFEYRALFVFLVWISTTVYGFYLDRKLTTEPDAYGIISSAAFATMSLCMSESIDSGFVELMLFFCGVLTTQLMKIKPLLGLVGIGFSCFLFNFRSYYFKNYEVIDIALPQSISNRTSSLDIEPLLPEHSIQLADSTALENSQPERPLGPLTQQQQLQQLLQSESLTQQQYQLHQLRQRLLAREQRLLVQEPRPLLALQHLQALLSQLPQLSEPLSSPQVLLQQLQPEHLRQRQQEQQRPERQQLWEAKDE